VHRCHGVAVTDVTVRARVSICCRRAWGGGRRDGHPKNTANQLACTVREMRDHGRADRSISRHAQTAIARSWCTNADSYHRCSTDAGTIHVPRCETMKYETGRDETDSIPTVRPYVPRVGGLLASWASMHVHSVSLVVPTLSHQSPLREYMEALLPYQVNVLLRKSVCLERVNCGDTYRRRWSGKSSSRTPVAAALLETVALAHPVNLVSISFF
jgi:hypothetical protein